MRSLKYLHVDGSVFMEIDKTEGMKKEQGIISGPRYHLSHIPTIDAEVSQEVKTAIRWLTNVCGLHVSSFHNGYVNAKKKGWKLCTYNVCHVSY